MLYILIRVSFFRYGLALLFFVSTKSWKTKIWRSTWFELNDSDIFRTSLTQINEYWNLFWGKAFFSQQYTRHMSLANEYSPLISRDIECKLSVENFNKELLLICEILHVEFILQIMDIKRDIVIENPLKYLQLINQAT